MNFLLLYQPAALLAPIVACFTAVQSIKTVVQLLCLSAEAYRALLLTFPSSISPSAAVVLSRTSSLLREVGRGCSALSVSDVMKFITGGGSSSSTSSSSGDRGRSQPAVDPKSDNCDDPAARFCNGKTKILCKCPAGGAFNYNQNLWCSEATIEECKTSPDGSPGLCGKCDKVSSSWQPY